MTDNDAPTPSDDGGPRFPRWLKWGLLGALAILVVGYGAILVYANFINDPEDEFDEDDLEQVLAGDDASAASGDDADTAPGGDTGDGTDITDATVATTDDPATPPDTAAPTDDGEAAPLDTAPSTSTWTITSDSELGYRVKEVLFGVDTEAVGRTNEVTGSLTIEGTTVTAAEFVVDVASITSDESRRDGQFRGRIMSTDEFPTATFTLTEPIELGFEPVDGAEIATAATGDLTLRGVTNTVTFDLDARLENGRIGVLGNIPVVFADYSIANPSFGGITTEDDGLLEFVLVFEPA